MSRNYRNNKRSNYGTSGKRKIKSGCKMGTSPSGKTYITGYRYLSGSGLLSFIANATDEVFESKSGVEYQKYVVNIEYHNSGVSKVKSGFYNAAAKKLYIPDINSVASLNKSWFGQIRRS